MTRVNILKGACAVIRDETGIEIVGDNGEPIKINGEDRCGQVAICRCGRSQSQPFCDGSHVSRTKSVVVSKIKHLENQLLTGYKLVGEGGGEFNSVKLTEEEMEHIRKQIIELRVKSVL